MNLLWPVQRLGSGLRSLVTKMTAAERARWAIPGAPPGIDTSKLTQPYKQHTWVYTCIDDIATKICSVPVNLYTGTKENPRIIPPGPLTKAFRRPNDHWSGNDLIRATVTQLMLHGNSVWLVDRSGPREVPREIWCLSYKYFTPKFYEGTWNISHWEMRSKNGNTTLQLAPHNVIFFRLYNPYSEFWGLAPLDAAKQALDQDWLAILLNRNFFENGAIPGGVLKLKNAGEEKRKRYQKWFDTKYTGASKAFKTLVLNEGDADFQQAALSHEDMQFILLRKMSRDEICAVYHVPVSEVGVQENIHKAVDKNVTKKYWAGPLKSLMRLMTDALASQFFDPYDDEKTWIEFDLASVEALQEAEEVRWDKAFKAWNMGWPAKHCNDRYDLRMTPFEGWDVSYIPAGMVRADGKPLGGGNGELLPGEQLVELPEEDAPKKSIAAPHVRLAYTVQQEQHVKGHLSKQHDLSRELERDLRDYLNEERKELERIFAGFLIFSWASEILSLRTEAAFDLPPAFDLALRDIATGHFERIGKELGPMIEQHIAAAGVDFTFDIKAPAFQQFLEEKVIGITGINERSRAAVRKLLTVAAQQGKTVAELQDDVLGVLTEDGVVQGGIFGDLRKRAQKIARTETHQVSMGLEYRAMQLAGISHHQWLAILDGKQRDSHEAMMALGPWPIGQVWPNGCFYPGDYNGPPEETINCRCSLQAVR